nr:MAG TPA: hypothetical protein [Caudoviricetes sp.]
MVLKKREPKGSLFNYNFNNSLEEDYPGLNYNSIDRRYKGFSFLGCYKINLIIS